METIRYKVTKACADGLMNFLLLLVTGNWDSELHLISNKWRIHGMTLRDWRSSAMLVTWSYNIVHEHRGVSRESLCNLSFFLSATGIRTTTCIVMRPPGSSPTGSLESASVLLFSSIFPALISFKSFIVLGPFSFSLGHCVSIFSLSDATVVAGLYLCGPMSVPSDNLNLTSIKSWLAIDELSSKTPLQILITLSKKPG